MDEAQWRQLRQAFDSALESGSAPSGDGTPEGTTREVNDLLAHLQADSFLNFDRSPASTASLFHEGELQPVGAVIASRYTVLAHLGQGGMGDGYEVEDGDLSETVALKMLRFGAPSTAAVEERMKREMRNARRIVHRNVCRQFDIGYDGEGASRRPYLTMERVHGTPLSEHLRQGRPELPAAVALAGQLCAGLQAVHEQHIVHADLKPQNLLVEQGTGRLVLLDFGLSRIVRAEAPDGASASRMFAGTPAYIAPECYEGSAPTFTADMYALGIVLHQVVAGEIPSPHRDGTGKRQLHATVPEPWRRAITACLALNPAERPTQPADVWSMLQGDESQPVRTGAAEPRPVPETAAFRKRWIAGTVVLLLTVAAAIAFWLHAHRSRPAASTNTSSDAAQLQSKDLFQSGRAYLARQTLPSTNLAIQMLQQALQQEPGNAAATGQLARAYGRKYELTHQPEWLNQASSTLARAEALAPASAGTLLARGVIERARGNLAAAAEDLHRATELDPADGEIWRQLGRTLNLSGNVLGAQTAFQDGLKHDHAYWGLYQEFGNFYLSHGQADAAEKEFLIARQLAPDQPIVLSNLGGLYLSERKLTQAQQVLTESLRVEPSASSASNLGALYLSESDLPAAINAFRLAVTLSPDDYRIWNNLGAALERHGELSQARLAYRKVTDLLERSLKVSPHDPVVLGQLALYAAREGNAARARQYEARALSLAPQNADIYLDAAVTEQNLGNTPKALALLERALQLGAPPHKIDSLENMGEILKSEQFHRLMQRWRP